MARKQNTTGTIREIVTMNDIRREPAQWQSTQGWRERAMAAYEEKKSGETERFHANLDRFAILLNRVLGIEMPYDLPIEGEGDTVTLDGVTFRMLRYDEPTGDQLVMLRPCAGCGKPTPSPHLKTALDVGEALEEWEPQCRGCHQAAAPNATAEASGAAARGEPGSGSQ